MISPSAQAGKFVISLCTVAVPIAIPQPRSPELMRYRFFLHTCWEEGTRCHRLYMGYFDTREDAQKWLGTLRRIYPSAFVSVSPQAQALSGSQVVSLLDQPASFSRAAHSTQTGAPAAASPPPRQGLPHSHPSLQETVEALKMSALDAAGLEEDPLNSTGVRHLRIEIQKEEPRPRADKRAGARKP